MKLNWCFQELILGLPGAAYQRQIGRDEVYLFGELLPLPRAHRPRQLQTNTHSHQLSCSFNIDSRTLPFLPFDTPHSFSLLQLNSTPHSSTCSLHLSQFHTHLSPPPPPLSLSLPLSNTHTLRPRLRAGFIRRQVSEV